MCHVHSFAHSIKSLVLITAALYNRQEDRAAKQATWASPGPVTGPIDFNHKRLSLFNRLVLDLKPTSDAGLLLLSISWTALVRQEKLWNPGHLFLSQLQAEHSHSLHWLAELCKQVNQGNDLVPVQYKVRVSTSCSAGSGGGRRHREEHLHAEGEHVAWALSPQKGPEKLDG